MKTLVVAANNRENTDWTEQVKDWDIMIYNEPYRTHSVQGWAPYININHHPAGRETDTYLDWICNNYGGDWDEVVVAQGHPFDHDPEFIAHLSDPAIRYYGPLESCDPDGMPRIEWAMLDSWCRLLGLTPQPRYHFVAGAQYRLTREQIATRSLDFYKAIYYLTKIPANQGLYPGTNMLGNPAAYSLERLWSLIWNINLA